MLVIAGYVVVVVSVLGGYLMHGGSLILLWQPSELIIIGGAAVGALLTAGGPKVVGAIIKALPMILQNSPYNKDRYTEVLILMHDIFVTTRREGVLALEQHIENPEKSELFRSVPSVSSDHHAVEFITDYLRLVIGGNFDAMQLENLMEMDIASHHEEAELPASSLNKMADGLPAFGIVAAVMGVVVTMTKINEPPEILGGLIGAALVGTFLGVLLSYGFIGPIGSLLELRAKESTKFFETIKVCLIASLNGYDPATAVEFGRKILYSADRPSFKEMEKHLKRKKG